VSTQARVVFGLLVAATFAAFFVAQRLKHVPTEIQHVRAPFAVFSPNHDGIRDRLRVSFELKTGGAIGVDAIDDEGDPVRSLIDGRTVRAHQRIRIVWNGREDDGSRAPDGAYRLRITLRDSGRDVLVRRRFRIDTTPPTPKIASIDPSGGSGPALLPNRAGKVTITTQPTGFAPSVEIFRTSTPQPQLVARLPVADKVATWDGKLSGVPVRPGSFVAVAEWRDRAGNLGSSVPLDPKTGVPQIAYGRPFPGHGGITVRYLEVEPPTGSVAEGALMPIGVDARGAIYHWSLRRLGATKTVRVGTTRRTPIKLMAPKGPSTIYLFQARVGHRTATVPIAVQSPNKRPVLVVLPLMTWQGRNAVDDDGDGSPNLLDAGMTARTDRVFAYGALPQGFAAQEGPLLAYLARNRRSFDITTDVALAQGRGPGLAGHHGVLLPGDVRWLPRSLQLSLRGFVRDGGTLVLDGLDSLRRDVALGNDGVLRDPTPPADTNLFGSKLRDLVRKPTTLTNLNDTLQLFTGGVYGGTGVFSGFPGYEPTAALGPDEKLAANAVTPDGQTVLVAARYGKGLEIRTGALDFATRLNADRNTGELLLRMFTLLAA
jgi:hypothetical protein